MIKKDRDICRIWDEVTERHPKKSTKECMQMACDLYNVTYRDDIDHGDIASALEARANE